jgi:methylated-DNA-[protein]-cysteine S-methyltransferase
MNILLIGRSVHKYSIFKAKFGYLGLVLSERGLAKVFLFEPKEKTVKDAILKAFPEAQREEAAFTGLKLALEKYLQGDPEEIKITMDVRGATPFEMRVWEACNDIEWGQTRSYAWVAEKTGVSGGARAVGQALGKNPFPLVIPCHRVIEKDGSLGGYAGGENLKYQLLRHEGRFW